MNFLVCTLTGIGTVILAGLAMCLIVTPIVAVGYGAKALSQKPRFMWLTKAGYALAVLSLTVLAGFFLVMFHDMGCDVRHHPEQKIFKDNSQQQQHNH